MIAAYPLLYMIFMSVVNPAMYFSWYYPPLIPGLLVAILAFIWFQPSLLEKHKLTVASIVAFLLILIPGVLLISKPGWALSRSREEAFKQASISILGQDLNNSVVLAPDIGVIGWYLSDANILDPIGLVSPEALAYSKNLPPDQLISIDLILVEEPDYIISLDQFINPFVINDENFQNTYTSIYKEDLQIIDTIQPLHIYKLNKKQ
jgi:hypothetical protein